IGARAARRLSMNTVSLFRGGAGTGESFVVARSGFRHCDESRRAEQRVNLGHPFTDRDFLRTMVFAVVAGNATTGPRRFRDKNLILEARAGNVFVEKRF